MMSSKTQDAMLSAATRAETWLREFAKPMSAQDMADILRAAITAAEHELKAPAMLAIVIEGGMISDIVSDRPELFADVEVLVIDYDTDGAGDDDRLIAIAQPSGGAEFPSANAYVSDHPVDRAKIDLAAVAAALDARADAEDAP